MQIVKWKIVIFLGLGLLALLRYYFYHHEKSFRGRCERVFDGDTIMVDKKIIRLRGIDAPEKDQVHTEAGNLGAPSLRYLVNNILGKEVTIKYKRRGVYGRFLGQVFHKERDINYELAKLGLVIGHGKEEQKMKVAIYLAKLRKLGLYKIHSFENPSFWRKKKRSLKER